MVIVIVISGILSTMLAQFIVRPIAGYVDMTRRATLVNAADNALRRMARDIRRALPNSTRIAGGGQVLEVINSVDGARYRDDPPPGNPDKRLEFNKADKDFNMLGLFTNLPARPLNSTSHRLVIYNTGVIGADAYQNLYVITPPGMSVSIDADAANPTEDHVTLGGAGFQFAYQSPGQRLYLVDGPVSFLCDTGAGTLTRYSGHPIAAGQLATAGALTGAGASGALLANQVSACNFTYQPGTSQRAGLVTLTLTLNDSDGNTVTLLHQVHIDNVP